MKATEGGGTARKKAARAKRAALAALCLLAALAGCAGEDATEEERAGKYDFISWVELSITGANGAARIETLRLRTPESEEFESDGDFIAVKQAIEGGEVEADVAEDLQNGDVVTLSFSTDAEADASLLCADDYEYVVSGLEEGIEYDLAEVEFALYSFESAEDAEEKLQSSSGYEMALVAIPAQGGSISAEHVGAIDWEIETDDAVFEFGETIYSLEYGIGADYIVENGLWLSQLSYGTGLSACETKINGTYSCAASYEAVLKEAPIAEQPDFGAVDMDDAAAYILSFINARYGSVSKGGTELSSAELAVGAFDTVVAVYKYEDASESSSYLHGEMYDYKYAVLASGINDDGYRIFCLFTMGMLQNGDYLGLFECEYGGLELDLVEAGYTGASAARGGSGYTLSPVAEF